MRKITFYIDDVAWLKERLKLSDKKNESIFKNQSPFRVVYTLIGSKSPDRYELTDMEGNKLNINDLNGYERGVVLNDCYAYYMGGKYTNGGTEPCGVMKVVEENIKIIRQ